MRIGESVVDRLQGVEHVAPGRNGEIVEAGDLLPVNVDCRPVAFQMDDDLDPVAELLTHTAVFESGIHVRQVTFGSGYSPSRSRRRAERPLSAAYCRARCCLCTSKPGRGSSA